MNYLFESEDKLIEVCEEIEQSNPNDPDEIALMLEHYWIPALLHVACCFEEASQAPTAVDEEGREKWEVVRPEALTIAQTVTQAVEALKTASHTEMIQIAATLKQATAPMQVWLDWEREGEAYNDALADANSY